MGFSEDAIKNILSNEPNRALLNSAREQESQLRVFTETMDEYELGNESYWSKFLLTMKNRLSETKYNRTKSFIRYPLLIVQLSDSILTDFYKVFEGKNRHFNVEGDRDTKVLNDWITENDPVSWIEDKSKDVFKNKPNSFVVVDRDEKGQPYLLFIDSDRIVDASFLNKSGDLKYIAFIHSTRQHEIKKDVVTTLYSFYDDSTYWVFSKDSDDDNYILVKSVPHNIGYCPARSFLTSCSNSRNLFKRRNIFTSAVSKMEDWALFDIYRNFVDHYAPFPVTEAAAVKCVNSECQNGQVQEEVVTDNRTGDTKTVWTTCTACNGVDKGAFTGPGTHIKVQVSSDKDEVNPSGVFKMIMPDTAGLKYTPDKLDDLELEIRLKSVGVNTLASNEAFNELQVKGSFASMETILLRAKSELDNLYKWVVSTVGKSIYKNISLDVEANFGTEFYLISEDDLQIRYDNSKKIGLPLEEQLNIYKQLIHTKYKGNTSKLNRELMLLDLDPFPMHSIDECITLKNESVLDDFQLSLKVNFLKFISKFEHDNTEITQFASNLEYNKRIELIEKELNFYNETLIEQKNIRNNPNSGLDNTDSEPQVTQEQLDAQANLRGTVGGVQGVLEIQASVNEGITEKSAALEMLNQFFGITNERAEKLLGNPKQLTNNIIIEDESKQNTTGNEGA